jgi:hypothetical protein
MHHTAYGLLKNNQTEDGRKWEYRRILNCRYETYEVWRLTGLQWNDQVYDNQSRYSRIVSDLYRHESTVFLAVMPYRSADFCCLHSIKPRRIVVPIVTTENLKSNMYTHNHTISKLINQSWKCNGKESLLLLFLKWNIKVTKFEKIPLFSTLYTVLLSIAILLVTLAKLVMIRTVDCNNGGKLLIRYIKEKIKVDWI